MLDIGVGDAAHRTVDPSEPWLGLENDGYYWFLYPLFDRLATETGQSIDLYGDAVFAGPVLLALSRTLSEARRAAEDQPESWEVYTGTQDAPVRREVFGLVTRSEFLRLLGAWDWVIKRARELGRAVVCHGD